MSTEIGSAAWTEKVTKAAMDNRTNQLNPEHPAYWSSRSQYISVPAPNQRHIGLIVGAAIGAAAVGTVWAIHKLLKNIDGDLFGSEEDTEELDAEFEDEEEYEDDEEEE